MYSILLPQKETKASRLERQSVKQGKIHTLFFYHAKSHFPTTNAERATHLLHIFLCWQHTLREF